MRFAIVHVVCAVLVVCFVAGQSADAGPGRPSVYRRAPKDPRLVPHISIKPNHLVWKAGETIREFSASHTRMGIRNPRAINEARRTIKPSFLARRQISTRSMPNAVELSFVSLVFDAGDCIRRPKVFTLTYDLSTGALIQTQVRKATQLQAARYGMPLKVKQPC